MDKWPIFDQNHGKSSGADWCNLVHSGTTWYTLVNFVQFGVTWCRLVQLGKDWCNLVQFGATWCNLVNTWILFTLTSSLPMNIQFLYISHYRSWMYRYTSATTKSTQICTQNPLTNISTFSSLPFTLTTRQNYPIQPPSSNTPYISTNYVFDQRRKKLANYLMKRGYSRRFLQRAITRVRAIPRHETLKQQEHTNSTTDRTPFVSTFTPLFIKFLRF